MAINVDYLSRVPPASVAARDAEVPNEFVLTPIESLAVDELARDITASYESAEDPRFVMDARTLAYELPRRLRVWAERMRQSDGVPWFRIRSHRFPDEELGPTPPRFEPEPRSPALPQEICLMLFGSLLGDPFGWETQQAGRLLHDIVPAPGQELSQTSACSAAELAWHTEDAFHPYRADYLVLGCLRNPDETSTTIACVSDLELDRATEAVLAQPRFLIAPDDSHSPAGLDDDAAWRDVEPVAILTGRHERPMMRIDPEFMAVRDGDDEAQAALDRICEQVEANLREIWFAPGDYVFIDNHRCVHGRKPFVARFDGTDRWLKRLSLTRDLRKMTDAGVTPTGRQAQRTCSYEIEVTGA
ncbi:MAG: arginine beta-hydroxylase, Fe(II)/alpha-ketoglutarate-dependent [Micrococcales bacterium]|nr:MAG: arginine beta-hydroxylase, Fe(II)/alpha-ketoglutarate-dependent [Micrococcales bacterium]